MYYFIFLLFVYLVKRRKKLFFYIMFDILNLNSQFVLMNTEIYSWEECEFQKRVLDCGFVLLIELR